MYSAYSNANNPPYDVPNIYSQYNPPPKPSRAPPVGPSIPAQTIETIVGEGKPLLFPPVPQVEGELPPTLFTKIPGLDKQPKYNYVPHNTHHYLTSTNFQLNAIDRDHQQNMANYIAQDKSNGSEFRPLSYDYKRLIQQKHDIFMDDQRSPAYTKNKIPQGKSLEYYSF